ncbi:MAG TPA: hypothetical protein VKR54_02465 [Candidatus Babeliales bacterium]|jgi:hypothetical protein|nr:hypothetical protein [Candidatus Babeliales bacterium]
MKNIFSTKIILFLITLNSYSLCMQRTTMIMPTVTKNSRKTINHRAYCYNTKPHRFQEDKMAFYKQFSKETKNNNLTHQQAQPQLHAIDEQMGKQKEDKMAFYKQFSKPKE